MNVIKLYITHNHSILLATLRIIMFYYLYYYPILVKTNSLRIGLAETIMIQINASHKRELTLNEKEEKRFSILNYFHNSFETKNPDERLDIAIKGTSKLDFFQSQIPLLEDCYLVLKNSKMDKKYQLLPEQVREIKFSGHKINPKTLDTRLLDSKIVSTSYVASYKITEV